MSLDLARAASLPRYPAILFCGDGCQPGPGSPTCLESKNPVPLQKNDILSSDCRRIVLPLDYHATPFASPNDATEPRTGRPKFWLRLDFLWRPDL